MAQMTLRISQEMFMDRLIRKLMLMDEAWDLMAGMSGKFMEDLARRVRKYEGSMGTGTQGLSDYYEKSDASRAALMQSDFTVLLRQKEESLKQLEKDSRLDASPYELRTLKSLNTIRSEFRANPSPNGDVFKGGYSEIYVKSPMGKGTGRLILDPYSLLLYSTLPKDFNAVEAKLAQGMDVSGAIKSVLADRGVRV
jgi:conjugal transfer ATP-binding protein TraC